MTIYQNSQSHKENARSALSIANSRKSKCDHCDKITTIANAKKHENSCYLNPSNLKPCPVCSSPIKNYKTSTTCGYSCSNKYYNNVVRNKPENFKNYRTICFYHHDKVCIICGESNIVEVHHFNENHSDNRPENLVPLCPTHHQYIHSNHKHLIQKEVENYVKNWSERSESN